MKYRIQITCGIGFESLKTDYEKKYNLIVHDPELDIPYDPFDFGSVGSLLYMTECKFCKEKIRLPSTAREIALTGMYSSALIVRSDNHSYHITHLNPTVTEDDDFLNVREVKVDGVVIEDDGPLTIAARETKHHVRMMRGLEKLDAVKTILNNNNLTDILKRREERRLQLLKLVYGNRKDNGVEKDNSNKRSKHMETFWKLLIVSLMVSAILKFLLIIEKALLS